jgi:hypothetical protein
MLAEYRTALSDRTISTLATWTGSKGLGSELASRQALKVSANPAVMATMHGA